VREENTSDEDKSDRVPLVELQLGPSNAVFADRTIVFVGESIDGECGINQRTPFVKTKEVESYKHDETNSSDHEGSALNYVYLNKSIGKKLLNTRGNSVILNYASPSHPLCRRSIRISFSLLVF